MPATLQESDPEAYRKLLASDPLVVEKPFDNYQEESLAHVLTKGARIEFGDVIIHSHPALGEFPLERDARQAGESRGPPHAHLAVTIQSHGQLQPDLIGGASRYHQAPHRVIPLA